MDIIRTDLILSNYNIDAISPVLCTATYDSSVRYLCIPENLALHLSLTLLGSRELIASDGTKKVIPYVAPIQVKLASVSAQPGARTDFPRRVLRMAA